MIITQQKDLNEVWAMVKDYKKILIAGCDGCCQPPRSISEAKVLGQLLELKARTEGKELKWKYTPMTLNKSYFNGLIYENQTGTGKCL